MGDHKIEIAESGKNKARFIQHLLDDIEALEIMIKDGLIEQTPIRIGAEQEFCIVDDDWTPSGKALKILDAVKDNHFTTELALFNLEINMDPIELKENCFQLLMDRQLDLLKKAEQISNQFDAKTILTGILPTIAARHLQLEYMTPSPRYYVLNEMMRKLRGSDFSLHIMGADELTMMHDSVLFEACNTSYQIHLQIDPLDFVNSYNWAQAIAGPLLAISANSPILLGKELWSETRIALFQQSIDTRGSSNTLRQNEPRVTFGNEWLSSLATDIYKDDISRFKLLVSKSIEESSLDQLARNEIPKLEALSLHNGTIYRWNRACYGVGGGKPHLRIENRYIPSGPTVVDEVANAAFWVGMMMGRPKAYNDIGDKMEFVDARSNFIKAARTGKESQMRWMGERVSVSELVLTELIPIAREGLLRSGVDSEDINFFLGVIEDRVKESNGAEWQLRNFRKLKGEVKTDNVMRLLCAAMHANQQQNIPVSKWDDIEYNDVPRKTKAEFVYEIMTSNLFTVNEEDPATLAAQIMSWKNIHHVPVENEKKQVVGILTENIIREFRKRSTDELLAVKDIMERTVICVEKDETIAKAEKLMIRNQIGCLPVIKNQELIGIITKSDLIKE